MMTMKHGQLKILVHPDRHSSDPNESMFAKMTDGLVKLRDSLAQ